MPGRLCPVYLNALFVFGSFGSCNYCEAHMEERLIVATDEHGGACEHSADLSGV